MAPLHQPLKTQENVTSRFCGRYTDDGFIVNDVTLRGGLLALRNGFYSWAPDSLDFSAITLLNPLPGQWPPHIRENRAASLGR